MGDFEGFQSIYSRIVTKCQFTESFEKKFEETINGQLNGNNKEKTISEKWLNLEFGTKWDLLWAFELIAIVILSIYVFNDMFDIRDEIRSSGFPNPEKTIRS